MTRVIIAATEAKTAAIHPRPWLRETNRGWG